MANNSSNHQNNNNQPRRKRNRKPVKRYSEEYNNRPNPYTGYSSDGNYHPGAKKRPISEASASNAAKKSAGTNYDYSRAAMTDAVWPPANTQNAQNTQNTQSAKSTQKGQQPSAAKPVSTAARGNTPKADAAPQRPEETAPISHDIADLAETAAKLEGTGNASYVQNTQNTENTEGGAAAGNTARRSGSHRKKHTNRQESEQARKAKIEAKKAALDKIARGVAAHSVSEQMIDDISNMSEAIESMAKAEKAEKAEKAAQTESVRPGGGVNWDELYDAAFPPKTQEPEQNAPAGGKGKKAKAKKQRREFDEVSEQHEPMLVKPVMLGEDEALPYDLIVEENAREAEEAKAAEEAWAKAAEEAVLAEQKRLAEADAFRNPPLEPSDLIPVLDFEKPDKPVIDLSEPVDDTLDAAEDIADVAETVTIEEIINAVEQEKFDTAISAEAAVAAVVNSEAGFSGIDFETRTSEGWHEITPPAAEESHEEVPTAETEAPRDDDSVNLLSQRLLESYMELEEQPLAYLPEDEAEEAVPEAAAETVDLNEFFASEESTAPVEVEVMSEKITEDAPEQPPVDVVTVDIDIAEIEDEIFAETDIASLEEENIVQEKAETSESGEEAVKEKIEKLVEAAELAEVLRQESEDADDEDGQNAEVDVFSVSLPAESLPEGEAGEIAVTAEEEPIREYRPRGVPKDENVFESVLIVDDSRSVVDDEAAKKQDDMQFLHAAAAAENPTAVFRLPDGPIALPADIDDADFREHWLDEDEDGDEMATRSKRTRRRISAFIGGVVILFVVMVVVSVLSTVITGFSNIGSTNEKKVEYSEFITPVVLNDPAPFESIDKAENQMLLESAIWRVLGEMSATEDYEYTYDATRKIVVPADDVAEAGRELFGNEVQLDMNVLSESDGSAIYYYDSIDNSFHISTGGVLGPAPVITKIAQKSDYISLIVGYVNQDEMTLTSSDDDIECYKYMEYVLALQPDNSYYIQSVRDYVEE